LLEGNFVVGVVVSPVPFSNDCLRGPCSVFECSFCPGAFNLAGLWRSWQLLLRVWLSSPENALDGIEQTANLALLNDITKHACGGNTKRRYRIETRAVPINLILKVVHASIECVFLSFFDFQRIHNRPHLLQVVAQLLLCRVIKTNRISLSSTGMLDA